MVIKTKFELSDVAWFMHDNKAGCGKVEKIQIDVVLGKHANTQIAESTIMILYTIGFNNNHRMVKREKLCFISKPDLLKSL